MEKAEFKRNQIFLSKVEKSNSGLLIVGSSPMRGQSRYLTFDDEFPSPILPPMKKFIYYKFISDFARRFHPVKQLLVAVLVFGFSTRVDGSVVVQNGPASSVTFGFDEGYTDNSVPPSSLAPWITATFVSLGSNKVRLTLDNALTGNDWLDEVVFNLNPALSASSANMTISPISQTGAFLYVAGVGAFGAGAFASG